MNGFQIALGETLNNCWSYGDYEDNDNSDGMVYHDERSTFDVTLYEDGTVESSGDNGVVVNDVVEEPEVCLTCPETLVTCPEDCFECEIIEDSCDMCSFANCLDGVVDDPDDEPEVCIICPEIVVSCPDDCEDCEIIEDSCDECAYVNCLDEEEPDISIPEVCAMCPEMLL